MKEIKFRGLCVLTGEWLYGGLIQLENVTRICWVDERNVFCSAVINKNTLTQFTGLKDKNGREIYEGDILTSKHYPFQRDGEYNYHVLVEWGNEQAAYYLTKYLANKNRRGVSHLISDSMEQYNMATFEIIGNIHENPELLEVAE